MKNILNLVYPDKSDFKYKVYKYPDGQQDVVITQDGDTSGLVQISSRFSSFKDLELIICATKALKRKGLTKIILYIPYILGCRSDRQFEEGGTSYLVDVIAPILNAQNYASVRCYDAHSDVAAACINNLYSAYPYSLINIATKDKDYVLASPDAGALKKIYSLADKIGYKEGIIKGNKHRVGDTIETGIAYPKDFKDWHKDLVLVDDIGDGCKTFIEFAKAIEGNFWSGKKYLVLTHGIFSKGFSELSEHFDGIYCTNSYKDITVPLLSPSAKFQEIHQLNVF